MFELDRELLIKSLDTAGFALENLMERLQLLKIPNQVFESAFLEVNVLLDMLDARSGLKDEELKGEI